MTDDVRKTWLSAEEQQAAWVMARFAAEAGYRSLGWSLPNDASWPHQRLAGLPVRYTSVSGSYDLTGRPRFGASRVVCSMVRDGDDFEVRGVPGEEWLRSFTAVPAAVPVEPDGDAVPTPLRGPRSRLRLTAAALGLVVPLTALGGVVIVQTTGSRAPAPQASAPQTVAPAPAPVMPAPALPANGTQWASDARVTLAAVSRQLDTVSEAEAAWLALPPEYRMGEPPAPVRDLQASRVRLEQQQAALAADLAIWEALKDTRTALVGTEQQLADVRRAGQLDANAPTSSQLRIQEKRLARQVDVQRMQLDISRDGVDQALAAPLPEPVDAQLVAAAVIAITQDPPEPPAPTSANSPVIVIGRDGDPGLVPEVLDDDEPDGDDPEPQEPDDDRSEDPVAEVVTGTVGGAVGIVVPGDDAADELPAPDPNDEVTPTPVEVVPAPVPPAPVDTALDTVPVETAPESSEVDTPEELGAYLAAAGAELERATAELDPEDVATFQADADTFAAQLTAGADAALDQLAAEGDPGPVVAPR